MPSAKPLDLHQQELMNVVKATHETLILARKMKNTEVARRLKEAQLDWERNWERVEMEIRMQMEREIAEHAAAEDAAVIAAYSEGIPVNRIALEGFGNRLPGAVHAKLSELRRNGLVGSVEGYRIRDEEDTTRTVGFPKPVDVSSVLSEAMDISEPRFTLLPSPLSLIEGDPEWDVQQVRVDLDPRMAYLKQIAKNGRPGTVYRYATYATLYRHPASGELTAVESKETGDITWDHPIARWVKDHPELAEEGFNNALSE